MSEIAPITRVDGSTPAGTQMALHIQEEGPIVTYGYIAASQPTSFECVKVPTKSRIVVDVHHVINSMVAMTLHRIPASTLTPSSKHGKTKTRTQTFGELQSAALTSSFPVVMPLSHLTFDSSELPDSPHTNLNIGEVSISSSPSFVNEEPLSEFSESLMYEANNELQSGAKGKKRGFPEFLETLKKILKSPPDAGTQYQQIKKDIFHAFHMIVIPLNHGIVDAVCRKMFNLTFDEMLLCNPCFIAACTPHHIPTPSVLVHALEYIFAVFGNATDAKTGAPLFNKKAWKKAQAVTELAREGYLSDVDGVMLYEKADMDQYGLQLYVCTHGTNKVEGGPHRDIYHKFGALHAGPWLTVNCLTDHCTWYNLQAYAKHVFGVNWDYHHDLGLINQTSFLLNYLSDFVNGAKSYADWLNGDLYERTEELFEPLQLHLGMEAYSDSAASALKLGENNDWM
ncbi:hypothetical protein IW262DRAFT_1464506 [Armillaria fumosa]|nr:hypothetical protein IW262DRAFT_1464506 [Armillaria fumosa]